MTFTRPRSLVRLLGAVALGASILMSLPACTNAAGPTASSSGPNVIHRTPSKGPNLLRYVPADAFPGLHGFGDPRFGVVEAYERPANADDLHVGWERVQIRWDLLQPRGPLQWDVNATNSPQFPAPDGPFNNELAHGRQLVGVIQGIPAWAAQNSKDGNAAVPKGINRPWNDPQNYWGQFVFRAARHYAGRIDTLVILNEVNIKSGNYYQFAGTPADYAQMLRVAYLAAHAANPHVEVHMYGDSVYADHGTWFIQTLKILSSFPGAQANNYFFDAVEMHLYSSVNNWDVLVNVWRTAMHGYGIDRPIWMSETNVAPRDDPVAPANPANHNTPLAIQPYFMIDSFAVGLGLGMPRIEVYRMLDPQHIFPEHPSGLLRRPKPGVPGWQVIRPEYYAFKTINTWFAGVLAAHYTACPIANAFVDKFCLARVVMERPGQEIQVVWNQGGVAGTATIPAVAPVATEVQPLGSTSTIQAKDGTFVVKLDGATDHAIDNPKAIKIGSMPLIIVQNLPQGQHVPGLSKIFVESDRSQGAQTLGPVTSVAVAPDGSGVRAIADTAHDRVLIEDNKGNITKILGGTGGAPGQFRGPAGVAIGADGTLYVADQGNARIQEFDLQGNLLGGFGTYNAGVASLKAPTAVAVAPNGTLYIADAAQDAVLHFSRTGSFLGRWGSFGYGTGEFDGIGGLAVDQSGNVYVADTLNNRVVEFDSNGNLLTQIGTGDAGAGASSLHWPTAVTVLPSGGVAIADADNGRVVLLAHPQTYLGGIAIPSVSQPGGIAIAADGTFYVSDTAHNDIVHLDSKGSVLGRFGTRGFGEGQFFNPIGLSFGPDGNLYVADAGNNRIEVMKPDGTFVRHIGHQGSAPGDFLGPRAVSVGADGSLWVADTANARIQHLSGDGHVLGISVTGINGVWGVAADGAGGVYYSARWGQRIYHWGINGQQQGWGGPGSGAGEFNHPAALATSVDGGTLYTVDEGNSRVQFMRGGRIAGQRGTADPGATGLGDPVAVAVAHDGSVAVLDAGRHRIVNYAGAAAGAFSVLPSPGVPLGVAIDTSGTIDITSCDSATGLGTSQQLALSSATQAANE